MIFGAHCVWTCNLRPWIWELNRSFLSTEPRIHDLNDESNLKHKHAYFFGATEFLLLRFLKAAERYTQQIHWYLHPSWWLNSRLLLHHCIGTTISHCKDPETSMIGEIFQLFLGDGNPELNSADKGCSLQFIGGVCSKEAHFLVLLHTEASASCDILCSKLCRWMV